MKKWLSALCVLVLALTLTACGGAGGSSSQEAVEEKTTSAAGDVISAEVPTGWCFISGTDMNGADLADFICHRAEYRPGAPYLQADKADQDWDDFRAVLESEDPFGTYYGEQELPNGTWYLAENAAAVLLDGQVLRVRGYECDFQSDEVQRILGSLQWAK